MYYNIQNYNFIYCFVWVCNLVSHLREEHRLRVLWNRVLGRISGPKGGSGRRLEKTAELGAS
jgi:hypothetical protein